MIKLRCPIIVEGKYDKITLENLFDTLIIKTDGFGIFKDTEKCELIRFFSKKSGVIILTDSDSAGNLIRAHIKNIVGDGKIINVYVPQISGKEKRKREPSKEGYLGVEGLTAEILFEAFKRSGITGERVNEKSRDITKTDMYMASLSGTDNAAENRKSFLRFCGLPDNLSPNAMLDIINTIYTFEEFLKAVAEWQEAKTKN